MKLNSYFMFVTSFALTPDALGKMLSLFPENEIHRNYRYSARLAISELTLSKILRMYRSRGDAENRPERSERAKQLKN